MTQETKLGIFVLTGIICLVVSILLLGNFQFQRSYDLNILFSDIAGLPNKAKVKISGVEVGSVKNITLEGDNAKVTAWIKSDVKVHRNTRASVVSTGIIGSKYLELTTGDLNEPLLKDGDTISGVTPLSLDKVIADTMKRLDVIVASFQGVDGKNIGENLGVAVSNIRLVTDSLKKALADQEGRLVSIVANVDNITRDIAEITSANKDDLRATMKEVRAISERLERVMAKIERGEGTVGKLVSDDKMGEDLKVTLSELKETTTQAKKVMRRLNLIETHWDYTMRYDTKYKYVRNDLGLRIVPKPGKFYYLGGNNLGDKDTSTDVEDKNTFNLLIGKEFGRGQVYAGAIRSKGGFGGRLAPFASEPLRRMQVTADFYDFGREAPVAKAQVNTGVRMELARWAFIGAQVEDVYYKSSLNAYFNVVIRDDDIAYILGVVGLAKP